MKKTKLMKEQLRAKDILAEIKPLLVDYFIGEIVLNCNHIIYTLPNGQKFIISVHAGGVIK